MPMLPSVSWQSVMEAPRTTDSDGNALNYIGAAQAQFFTDHYLVSSTLVPILSRLPIQCTFHYYTEYMYYKLLH